MNPSNWNCPYCNKALKSQRGQTQHINATPTCRKKQEESVYSKAVDRAPNILDREPELPQPRRSKRIREARPLPPDALDLAPEKDDDAVAQEDDLPVPDDDDVDMDEPGTDLEEEDEPEPEVQAPTEAKAINREMRKKFLKYAFSHEEKFPPLKPSEITQIKLLDVLKRKRAPMNAYQEVLEWHLREAGKMMDYETLKDIQNYTNRESIMKDLIARYNVAGLLPVPKKVTLPVSKARVTVPCTDAQEAVVSLLTDPRFDAADYLFFGDDPLQPPPEQVTWISDLNTGEAHLKTYQKLVTDPTRQVLLPVIMYIDGATTGQFSELPVTALKIALGIHKRTTRDKPHAWRTIAYIPQVRKQSARGKKIFKESGHLDSQDVEVADGEGDSADEEATDSDSDSDAPDGAPKAQDLHSMLRVALKSFVKLQKTGFIWDLKYKNKIYPDVEFILYVPFVKCDTEEGDLLCGKYLVRTGNVQHICRYCHCPTQMADDPYAKYKPKTQTEIERLVSKGDQDALQQISQQLVKNAFYSVRFHQANDRGIHGATPSEMLHALLLGIFKYVRDIFFSYSGKDSKLSEDLDGLAKVFGKALSRQSDRDLPNTNFNKGIRKGKLMAKQHRGVLLNMAAVLASSKGKQMLKKKKNFGGEQGIKDWIMLVELLLEWEAYLNEKRMKRVHVQRLARKHRRIMYIITVVAKRTEGMGLKLMKFHAIAHMMHDMVLYGVPMEFDTGSNESHHKPTKQAAKLTQRNEATFNMQTAKRLVEFLAIELAIEEVLHGKRVWDYYTREEDVAPDGDDMSEDSEASTPVQEPKVKVINGGTRIQVYLDSEDEDEPAFLVHGRSKHRDNTQWLSDVVKFLTDLQALLPDPQILDVFTEHTRDGTTFRGHPNYRGTGPWKDWVLVDWGPDGCLPSRIWCFVNLVRMPTGRDTKRYGGVDLRDGVYAVVEGSRCETQATNAEEEEPWASDLFIPLLLDTDGKDADGFEARKFYLASVDAFKAPLAVVPDIGGPPNRHFEVPSRSKWSDEFVDWLQAPHKDDDEAIPDEEGNE